jgi:hypothetical protein
MLFLSGVHGRLIGMLDEWVGCAFLEAGRRPVYVMGIEAGRGGIKLPGVAHA